jgi:hypothetical protein
MSLHFHPLRVRSVQPDTDEAVIVSFDVPDDVAGEFRFTHGQHLTVRQELAGCRASALLLDLRRHRPMANCASACARCRAVCFRPGSTST